MSEITGGIQLAPLVVDIKSNAKSLMNGIDEATGVSISKAEALGGKLSDVGGKLTKSLTMPITGAATIMGKFALDTEKDLASISGRLGTTAKDTQELKEVAQDLYNDGFGESLEDCVNDLVVLQQNISETSNMTKEQKEDLLKQISTMKSLFGAESEEITRTLNNMLKNGLITDIQDGLDIITRGFQEGLNSGGDLLDVLYEYSPQFKKLGLEGSESLAYIKAGLDAGAYNADKMADALKELSIRAIDGSDTTIQGFELMGKNADEMMRKFAAGGETAQEALKETLEGLKNIEDPLNQDLAGVDLFGTMWEDSSKQAILAMGDVTGGLDNVVGATKKASEEINNTSSVKFTTALRECKSELLPLGTELLNVATDILPSVVEMVKGVTNTLDGFSDGTKKTVVKLAILTAAFGPTLSVAGKLITTGSKVTKVIKGIGTASKVATGIEAAGATSGGIAGLTTGLGALSGAAVPVALGIAAVGTGLYVASENADLLSKSCNTTTEELSGVQKVLNYLSGSTLKSKEEMQALGLEYKDFNGNVSQDFQTKVHDMASDVKDFGSVVEEINLDGICTEEEANILKERISSLSESATKSVQETKKNIDNLFSKGSNPDGALTTNESYVYQILVGDKDETLQKITDVTNEMTKYIDDCVNKNITPDKNKIESYYAQLGQYQLEAQAQNQDEIIASQRNFAEQLRTMNIEDAAKLLTEKKKSYKEELASLQENNNAKIEEIEKGLMNCNAAQKPYLEAELKSLKDKNKQILDDENTKWKTQLDYIESFSPELLNSINILNGEILTKEEKASVESLNNMKEHYKGLSEITESGCYTLYNTQEETWESVAVTVDEATGRISAAVSENGVDYGAYSDKVEGNARNLMSTFQEKKNAIISYLGEMGYSYDATSNQIVDANGRAIGSIDQLKQNENGLYQTTLTVNGTPVNIVVNKDGTISSCNEINNALDNASRDRYVTIHVAEDYNPIGNDGYWQDWRTAKGTKVSYNHYNGLDNVPYDGYTARLHKGERVLTAKENEIYDKANNSNNTSNLNVNIENFNNNRQQDIRAFAEELEFYRKQLSKGGGRVHG